VVNGSEFDVEPNKFWITFNRGEWEQDLRAFYRRHIDNDTGVLDIGAWFGPSIFTALSFNPKKIIAVEANPDTFKILQTNIQKNSLQDIVSLHSCCISDRTGDQVRFGSMDKHVPHSAINGIGGDGITLETLSFPEFLEGIDLAEFTVIKIDIEGGERYLTEGLKVLSKIPGLKIYLALHPPFWPDKEKAAEMMYESFQDFELFNSGGEPLALSELHRRMVSGAKTHYPNRTGEFFDVILDTK
jgi:FkbM family methyltransferase